MRFTLLTLISFLIHFTATAFDYTGVYLFNKGLNKANGSLYVVQINDDSAFIMLQAVSGLPDFFTLEYKGFIRIENNSGVFNAKDSCRIQLNLSATACRLMQNDACGIEFSCDANYKRVSRQVKKGSSFMPGIISRKGRILKDSTTCHQAPYQHAAMVIAIQKDQEVIISDEYNGYYLVELKTRKNEFLWVSKKNVVSIK